MLQDVYVLFFGSSVAKNTGMWKKRCWAWGVNRHVNAFLSVIAIFSFLASRVTQILIFEKWQVNSNYTSAQFIHRHVVKLMCLFPKVIQKQLENTHQQHYIMVSSIWYFPQPSSPVNGILTYCSRFTLSLSHHSALPQSLSLVQWWDTLRRDHYHHCLQVVPLRLFTLQVVSSVIKAALRVLLHPWQRL